MSSCYIDIGNPKSYMSYLAKYETDKTAALSLILSLAPSMRLSRETSSVTDVTA